MNFLVLILTTLLLLPQQAVSYFASVHMVDTAKVVELEHEALHAQSDGHGHHEHDFHNEDEGEHRHSPNGPMHSHAKDLNGNSAPICISPSYKAAKIVVESVKVQIFETLDAMNPKSHEKSLFRPPIA